MSILARIIGTVGVMGILPFTKTYLDPIANVTLAQESVKALNGGNFDYAVASAAINTTNPVSYVMWFVVVGLLIAIWYGPVKKVFASVGDN